MSLAKMAKLIINHESWLWEMVSNNEPTLIAVVTTSVLILAALWYKLTLSSSSPPLPPGPRELPIVGYLPFLGRDLHKQFTTMAHTYGPIFKFHMGSRLCIVINNLEIAKEVLRDQDSNFTLRIPTRAMSIITYGDKDISFSSNSNWYDLRKILSSEVLNSKNLEACSPFRRYEVRKTIKNVYSKIGTAISISEICFSTELDVISSMLWQNSSDNIGLKERNLGAELYVMASEIIRLFMQPNVSDFFPYLAWLDLQGVEREMMKHFKRLDILYTNVIEDRIESNSKKMDDGIALEGRKDTLQILLELKDQKKLDLDQIKALFTDVVIGGIETTVRSIEWAMTEIMRHPKVMRRIQEELLEVVGVNNIVEESHLSKLQYLSATCKETARLHPLGPLLAPRSPHEDCIVGGYTIPRGSQVFLNIWSMQRDPRYWDNPLEFNPDRFLTNDETHKYGYNGNNIKFLPFGSGRRGCPGISLADKMQKYILASFLHSFDWSLPKDETVDVSEKFGLTLEKIKPLILIPSQRLLHEGLYM